MHTGYALHKWQTAARRSLAEGPPKMLPAFGTTDFTNVTSVYESLLAHDQAIADQAQANDEAIVGAGDVFWLLFGAVLVMFMQAGFALLEAGSVRAKNTKNILLKNTLDACIGAVLFWAFGFAFAFGGKGEALPFIGANYFFLMDIDAENGRNAVFAAGGYGFAFWTFQWAFSAAAATIVSGAVAERCRLSAYAVYTTIITGFIYPVIVHWVWSADGFLSAFKTTSNNEGEYDPDFGSNGMMDFAGSGVVHMTGGGAALVAAIILGPRKGRFDADGKVLPIKPHSTVLQAIGTFILWFGWYGFNCVSTLAFGGAAVAGRVAMNTTLAPAGGGLAMLACSMVMGEAPEVVAVLSGILGGLVAITAPCPVVDAWAALLIGSIGGVIVYGSSAMLKMMKVDDPLDASPIHFFAGAWGVISVGLFANKIATTTAYTITDTNPGHGGFFGDDGIQLGIQVLGVVIITLWTCGMSAIMFMVLKVTGLFRVSEEEEDMGLDESHHGGSAYDYGATGKVTA